MDAIDTFHGMIDNNKRMRTGIYKAKGRGEFNHYFNHLSSHHDTVELPIDKVEPFADYGRRIKDPKKIDHPIIAIETEDGKYRPLDGQHRIHTKRELGHKTVKASIVKIPRYSSGTRVWYDNDEKEIERYKKTKEMNE